MSEAPTQRQQRRLLAGVFFAFLSFYALTGPGRIDTIDGQFRFEVAWNIIDTGQPTIRDVHLGARTGRNGARYSYYGIAASVASSPLVWLGYLLGSEDGELARFLFSLTSAVYAAAALSLLLHWWLRLGIPVGRALGWTTVVGLATMLWPLAASAFDQAQHALFVLASAYAGYRASEGRRSNTWAVAAGLGAGILVLYQPTFVVLTPILALSLLGNTRPLRARPALAQLLFFSAALALCTGLASLYNFWRWGSVFEAGAVPGPRPPILGNPAYGIAGLLVSPGKGILWYSPVVVLEVWSLRALWRSKPALALTAVTMAVAHLVFISCLRFYGGDWCWGPRYLVMTLPLLALGLPFLRVDNSRLRVWMVRGIVTAGLLVQLAGVSMDHQGFFFARALAPWFWTDQTFYFRNSQLAYRIHELRDLFAGVGPSRTLPFAPGPYPALPTYCIFGTTPSLEPEWMKSYPVFYVPRPWPLWVPRLPLNFRPVPPLPTAAIFLIMGMTGWMLIRRGLPRPLARRPPVFDDTLDP
jgi:hypothetical protein